MKQKYFKFPLCFYEAAEKMTVPQRAEFYNSIFDYVFSGKTYTLTQAVEPFSRLALPYLDKEKSRLGKG